MHKNWDPCFASTFHYSSGICKTWTRWDFCTCNKFLFFALWMGGIGFLSTALTMWPETVDSQHVWDTYGHVFNLLLQNINTSQCLTYRNPLPYTHNGPVTSWSHAVWHTVYILYTRHQNVHVLSFLSAYTETLSYQMSYWHSHRWGINYCTCCKAP